MWGFEEKLMSFNLAQRLKNKIVKNNKTKCYAVQSTDIYATNCVYNRLIPTDESIPILSMYQYILKALRILPVLWIRNDLFRIQL